MTKQFKIFILLISFWTSMDSQINLVSNGSFEQLDSCSVFEFTYGSNLFLANGWGSSHNTPDLFSNCPNSSGSFYTPTNMFGNQTPFAGNNYAGFFNYVYTFYLYTEHLYTQLISPLIVGKRYFFSAKISRADSLNCATNKLGVHFRKNFQGQNLLDPQINTSHILFNDTVNNSNTWTLQMGSFIADSAYNYLYIGNFYDKPFIDTLVNNFPNKKSLQPTGLDYDYRCISYYYIDDVKLSEDSVFVVSNINEISDKKNLFKTWPNPASNKINIEFVNADNQFVDIKIINQIGDIVYEKKRWAIIDKEISIDTLPNGSYSIQIKTKQGQQTQKLIIVR